MPENFPVTNEMVEHLLNRGITLEEEMAVSLYNYAHEIDPYLAFVFIYHRPVISTLMISVRYCMKYPLVKATIVQHLCVYCM